MPDYVQTAVEEIDEQLRVLKGEASRLEAARAALTGASRRQGGRRAIQRCGGPRVRRTDGMLAQMPGDRVAALTRAPAKASVLAALAGGKAMTASQVATKAKLEWPTVSTTLSTLAKTGEVQKAERGYRLTTAG